MNCIVEVVISRKTAIPYEEELGSSYGQLPQSIRELLLPRDES